MTTIPPEPLAVEHDEISPDVSDLMSLLTDAERTEVGRLMPLVLLDPSQETHGSTLVQNGEFPVALYGMLFEEMEIKSGLGKGEHYVGNLFDAMVKEVQANQSAIIKERALRGREEKTGTPETVQTRLEAALQAWVKKALLEIPAFQMMRNARAQAEHDNFQETIESTTRQIIARFLLDLRPYIELLEKADRDQRWTWELQGHAWTEGYDGLSNPEKRLGNVRYRLREHADHAREAMRELPILAKATLLEMKRQGTRNAIRALFNRG